jgi:hypothetical protein
MYDDGGESCVGRVGVASQMGFIVIAWGGRICDRHIDHNANSVVE